MASTSLSRIEAWTEKWSDQFNPILVREVRQIFKSRQFALAFLFLLVGSWLAALWIVVVNQTNDPDSASHMNGRALMGVLFMILTAAMYLPVPMTAFHSFAGEFRDNALEMLQVSALSSQQIVWGKLHGAILQGCIYLSAVAPFICLTYQLGGVGILNIFGLLVLAVFISFALTTAALAAGSVAKTQLRQIFCSMALLCLIAFSVISSYVVAISLVNNSDEYGYMFCMLIPAGVITLISLGIAFTQVRPMQQTFVRVDYIDVPRLHAIARHMEEWIATNRRLEQWLATGRSSRDLAVERDFAAAYQQGGDQAVVLDRMMNHSRSYFLRLNFVTCAEALQPLLAIRRKFDEIVAGRSWLVNELGRPQVTSVRFIPGLLPPQPKHMAELEQAFAELKAALEEIALRANPVPELKSENLAI